VAPSEAAVEAVSFSGLRLVWQGGCAPTYSGISFQPVVLTDFTQDAVRFGWAQPRFLPPTYTAAAP
jgi:hypothetical protein